MIPKIVHQIWLSSPVPEKFNNWSFSFSKMLPDWERRLWDDEKCDWLVREKFPQYLETYVSLDNPVAKSDIIRYMVLCEYGGMYADMDCECKMPLDFVCDDDEFIIGTELLTNSSRVMDMYPTDLSLMYCQWAFLSRPKHPVLLMLLEQIHQNIHVKQSEHPILDFVKRTGPHAFTKAVREFLDNAGTATIVPASYFGCFETSNVFRFALSGLFPELFRKVYIRHHFTATWMDDKIKKQLMLRNLLFMPKPIARTAPN